MNAEEQRVHDKAMDLVCTQGAEIERLREYAGECEKALRAVRDRLAAQQASFSRYECIDLIDAALSIHTQKENHGIEEQPR